MPDSSKKATNQQNQTFFEIPDGVCVNVEATANAISRQIFLNGTDKRFLTVLITFARQKYSSDSESFTSIFVTELSEYFASVPNMPVSKQSIMNKSKKLVKFGFISQQPIRSKTGGRARFRFSLADISDPKWVASKEEELKERSGGRGSFPRNSSSQALIKVLERSNAQYIKALMYAPPVTDNWFTGVLDRATRLHRNEIIVGNRITMTIPIEDSGLVVQTTTLTGVSSEIMELSDQRVVRAIVTIVVKNIRDKIVEIEQTRITREAAAKEHRDNPQLFYYDQGTEGLVIEPHLKTKSDLNAHEPAENLVRNLFYIDVVKLAELMNYASPNSSSTRYQINKIIRRLYETNFRVVVKNPNSEAAKWIMKTFRLPDYMLDFRFITDMKSQFDHSFYDDRETFDGVEHKELIQECLFENDEHLSAEEIVDPFRESILSSTRLWQISVDDILFKQCLDPESWNVFSAHKEILEERSGVGQSLYNILNRTIGRKDPTVWGTKEVEFVHSFSSLHNLLWPTRVYAQFEEHMLNLLKRHTKNPEKFSEKTKKARVHKLTAPFVPEYIKMFGFDIELLIKDKQWVVKITRDKDDLITGDKSVHNRLKTRKESRKPA